jgi:hypothetical protein
VLLVRQDMSQQQQGTDGEVLQLCACLRSCMPFDCISEDPGRSQSAGSNPARVVGDRIQELAAVRASWGCMSRLKPCVSAVTDRTAKHCESRAVSVTGEGWGVCTSWCLQAQLNRVAGDRHPTAQQQC